MVERELDKALNGHVAAAGASASGSGVVNDLTGMVRKKKDKAPVAANGDASNGVHKRKA